MPRTVRKVRELVDEDPEMATVIETVLDAAEGEDPLQWGDVNEELSSGQWGRLIETGVLEDAGEGFRVADPEGVREALGLGDHEGDDATPEEPPGDSSWTTWDKTAGIVALMLFPGYYVGSIRETVGSTINIALGPVDTVLPFYVVILVLAVLTGLVTTLLQSAMMDMDRISYYQEKMSDLQERQKAARERGDDAELEALREEQMEQMGENLGMFKEQFRPMVWSMLLIIPVFLWMYWKLRTQGEIAGAELEVVLPLIGPAKLNSGGVGPMPTWIVWYFLCSLSFSQLVRKSLNVQTTPG